jgi:hypothetical protein
MAVGSTRANANQTVISTFSSTSTGGYTYSSSSSASTLTTGGNLGGTVTFATSFYPAANPAGYAGAINLTATTSSNVSPSTGGVPSNQGGFTGSYSVLNETGSTVAGVSNGSAFYTVNFTNAILTAQGGGAYALGGAATITNNMTGTTPITTPESFSLALTGATNPNGATGAFGYSGFSANDTSNASATYNSTPPAVPEPSTIALAALGTLGFVAYGLRRRNVRTA